MSRYFLVGVMAIANLWPVLSHAAAKDGLNAVLLPAQRVVLEARFPAYGAVRTCSGQFGGLDAHDVVAGIVHMNDARPIGIIWDGSKWIIHDIFAEIEQDGGISNELPLRWNFSFSDNSKEDFRCDLHLGKDDRIGGIEDDKPLFDLKKFGLEKNTVVCFEIDATYNNWNCVIYSPKDKRFRLWFLQVHAD